MKELSKNQYIEKTTKMFVFPKEFFVNMIKKILLTDIIYPTFGNRKRVYLTVNTCKNQKIIYT